MSTSSIISIRDMIEMAFGEPDVNIINLKLIQTILYLLARQLRVLERRVEIELSLPLHVDSNSTITVTEVKLQANMPKKRKKNKKTVEDKDNKDQKEKQSLLKHQDEYKKTTDEDQIIEHSKFDKSLPMTMKKIEPKQRTAPKAYPSLMETVEEKREKELRVIRQRADSRQEGEKSPTPMASLDSMELQYEKLLVVERLSPEEVQKRAGLDLRGQTPKVSIVTQEQFQALEDKVRELLSRTGATGSADFPENIKLMRELRKGASLTDAMAAMQLSARLEAAEKTLNKMLSLVTDLASKTPGIELDTDYEELDVSQTSGTEKQPKKTSSRKQTATGQRTSQKKESDKIEQTKQGKDVTNAGTEEKNCVEADKFDNMLQELHDELLSELKTITNTNTENTNKALKLAKRLETKLEAALKLDIRMNDLETLVSDYAEQINILDTGLSSQMTNYQEQLTQMQHDLETGLESMSEALANTGGDTTAILDLNTNFTNLRADFDNTIYRQKKLQEIQNSLHLDLRNLWQQIELLKESKSDREEVADALRDKAGLADLNGLVSKEIFDAVQGDLEKTIGAAYEKFNNQEIVWQKAIDDIFRELNEKADSFQLISLRDDINNNLEDLRRRIHAMLEILGEPLAAATSRKLFRDTMCLSCTAPATMKLEESDTLPTIPPFKPTSNANYPTLRKGDGDYNTCYPGKPIPRSLDPRGQYCQRFCGGKATALRPLTKRTPMNISQAIRIVSTNVGSDGKTYMMDDTLPQMQPCLPCNQPKSDIFSPLEGDKAPEGEDYVSEASTLSDFKMHEDFNVPKYTDRDSTISTTPPPPIDED